MTTDKSLNTPPAPFMDRHETVALLGGLSLFDSPVRALEWGSGNSTVFFSAVLPQGSEWHAVEHNEDWSRTVSEMIRTGGGQGVSVSFVPNDGPFRDGIDDGDYDSFREYILYPTTLKRKFQFVLVDGRARVECMQIGWMLLEASGLMVLHDAERDEYNRGVPPDGYWLRLVNTERADRKGVLFLAKIPGRIQALQAMLGGTLPPGVELLSNVATAQARSRSAVRFGETLAHAGFSEEAMHVFLNLLASDPQCGDAYNNLGVLLAEAGQLDEAVRILSLGVQAVPEHIQLAENLQAICGVVAQVVPPSVNGDNAGHQPPEPVAIESASMGTWAVSDGARPLCVFVNTCYPAFLQTHYAKYPELAQVDYATQKYALQATFFGDADFYSAGLRAAGWEAEDLIVNCDPLQDAWARENRAAIRGLDIAVEQIRRLRPHAVYLQDMGLATSEFLQQIRPYTALIVGQIASPLAAQTNVRGFDIIISSFPHFVQRFREAGLTAYYQPLAFEPRVLDALKPLPARRYATTFVGGISPAHGKGREFLEQLAGLTEIDFWGYGRDTLAHTSPIATRHHGEAWGLDMFRLLAESRITINRHIDVAENFANNMRLFEATGCGALLLTDYKDNLSDLFEIGKEVVAYRSPEECAALVDYYRRRPDEAEAIARAGQARTLRDHSYGRRMGQTAEILTRHLRVRTEATSLQPVDMSKISCNLQRIGESEVTRDLTTAWQSEAIPNRQRALVRQELAGMYRGQAPVVFKVLADCLYPIWTPQTSLLEVGCASGYYYEALSYLLNAPVRYSGADYSERLVAQARAYYPSVPFFVADGAHLPFADGEFDIAITASVLLHVPNYADHIKETARVARQHVVAHRTPVRRRSGTAFFKKEAYGVETVEVHFNEQELVELFVSAGCKLVQAIEYAGNEDADECDVTYVFRKGAD
jgi:SAM-dependent methyltransferase/predicted O-methyltransferase YrrM